MNARRICKYIFVFLGAAVTVNAVIATFAYNMHLGIILTYIVGAVFLLYGVFFYRPAYKLPKLVRYIFYAVTVTVTVFVLFLFIHGNSDNVTKNEDAVIVLGAGIKGEQLSENLQNRLDCALDYHSQNPDAVIVVSGGQGPQESITEALAMERYLIEQGVPEDKIIKEERAASTYENFLFSKELLDSHFESSYTVAFITSDYHVYRAALIAEEAGLSGVTHCRNSTPWYTVIPNGLREMLAVLKQWIFE